MLLQKAILYENVEAHLDIHGQLGQPGLVWATAFLAIPVYLLALPRVTEPYAAEIV